jgi:SprT protein
MVLVTKKLRNRVDAKIKWCIETARKHYNNNNIVCSGVKWDVNNSCGGCYKPGTAEIHLNPVLFNENVEDYLNSTIPHEVAHLVHHFVQCKISQICRRRRDVHGPGWKAIMRVFGIHEPARCHSYDVTVLRKTKTQKYTLICSQCKKEISVGPTVHRKILQGHVYGHKNCKNSELHIHTKVVCPEPTKEVSVNKIITKQLRVKMIVVQNIALGRTALIQKIISDVGMTPSGASTYYYNAMKQLSSEKSLTL